MDAGPGMWPAFWTLSTGWPPEFDIIEVWTAEPRIHQGYAYSGTERQSGLAELSPEGLMLDDYHTYGMGRTRLYFSTSMAW